MVVRTFEQLVTFFRDERIPHKADPAHQLVEIPGRTTILPGHLVLRWGPGPILQLIHAVIEDVPVDRVFEIAVAIAVLNDRLQLGGFGWSTATRAVYVRLVLPVFGSDGINPAILGTLGQSIVHSGIDFLPALRAVVDGASGRDIVALYEATASTETSGPDA